MLSYNDLYNPRGSDQKGSNAEEHDQMCKINRSASAKEIPPENTKDEVWIKGKVDHMLRNVRINDWALQAMERIQ